MQLCIIRKVQSIVTFRVITFEGNEQQYVCRFGIDTYPLLGNGGRELGGCLAHKILNLYSGIIEIDTVAECDAQVVRPV